MSVFFFFLFVCLFVLFYFYVFFFGGGGCVFVADVSFRSSLAFCVPLVTFLPSSFKGRFISPHYPLAVILKTFVPVPVTSILASASS